jgi:hypothetical protein
MIRRAANLIGVDPFDVDPDALTVGERPPRSRWALGSPCRSIRALDVAVHRLTPAMLAERFPRIARWLASTSPRWGRLAHPERGHVPLGLPRNPHAAGETRRRCFDELTVWERR